MTTPRWITNPGFLNTVTQNVSTSVQVVAVGDAVEYRIISGLLPSGLSLNTSSGIISGTPTPTWSTLPWDFVIRASNSYGVTDRTFTLDITGITPPIWNPENLGNSNLDGSTITNTTLGFLDLAPSYENPEFIGIPIVINRQYVDWQLTAITEVLPPGKKLFYYIPDNGGDIPPGLILTSDGRLYGYVRDKTRIDYTLSVNARYDVGPYSTTPYDYSSYQAPGGIKYFEKTYEFAVTATDGVSSATQIFTIHVKDPHFLSGLDQQSVYIKYPVVPQWIITTNLGFIRSNNINLFELKAYDPYPAVGALTYSVDGPLPDNFTFNTQTQTLLANLPPIYQFNTPYVFTILATKTIDNASISASATFSIDVLGDGANYISFVNSRNIGTVRPGEISELALRVNRTDGFATTFRLTGGSLPPGLQLAYDGTIVGRVEYSDQLDQIYTFSVVAEDAQRQTMVSGTFDINVDISDQIIYTNIYVRPFMTESSRSKYHDLVSAQEIINIKNLYRPLDTNFGVQKDMRMYLYHGIENIELRKYATAIQDNFYNKILYFGDIKVAYAQNRSGVVEYELVYIEMIDNLVTKQGRSVPDNVLINDSIYYTNSIENMRAALANIEVGDRKIARSEYYLPRYQQSVQSVGQASLNYVMAVPICYASAGFGVIIKNKIQDSGFDFKQLDFEIERMVVEKSIVNDQDQYVFFPRNTIN
jgi:hypothetical protein